MFETGTACGRAAAKFSRRRLQSHSPSAVPSCRQAARTVIGVGLAVLSLGVVGLLASAGWLILALYLEANVR
jgi:hypothetical protein